MKEVQKTYGCTVETHEFTRQRAESLQSTNHEDHIASKRFTSMTHYNFVRKLIPMPQAMKIPDAQAAVDKEWKKLETIPAWDLKKVKSKKEVFLEAQRDKKKVRFATLIDICHLKKCGVRTQIADVQRQSRAPSSGTYAVSTEQGSSASQTTAAKIMDVIARLPGWRGT